MTYLPYGNFALLRKHRKARQMKTRILKTIIPLICLVLTAVVFAQEKTGPHFEAVGKVIDDFHDAAAHGDKERYFGHLTNDAVYLGTDEWERWPKYPDFDDYVNGRFKDGSGWTYKSVERTIRFNDRSDVAWFDEVLYSEIKWPASWHGCTDATVRPVEAGTLRHVIPDL